MAKQDRYHYSVTVRQHGTVRVHSITARTLEDAKRQAFSLQGVTRVLNVNFLGTAP